MLRFFMLAVVLSAFSSIVHAGTRYEIQATGKEGRVTYEVDFGGGKAFGQFTAWDPISKQFVYLTWPRGKDKPEPVGAIWNHTSGEVRKLYQFPKVKHPLPVIPTIDAIRICPKTGDKDFTKKQTIIFD